MSDDVLYAPYTDAELETLRRCQKGEPVTAADMLLMLSVDMQLMEEWVNNIFALASPRPAAWAKTSGTT
jgi:hypothetical protein